MPRALKVLRYAWRMLVACGIVYFGYKATLMLWWQNELTAVMTAGAFILFGLQTLAEWGEA